MTKYTTLPTSDANLQVTVVDDDDLVVLNINPASITVTGGGGGAVSSVNSQTGAVVLDTDDIAQGSTNLYSQQPNSTSDDVTFNTVTADLYGAIHLNVKNDEGAAISQGDPVYFKGVSGNNITVGVADADDPLKMPAFGIAATDANDNATLDIITSGKLEGIDTSAYSVNDELYVSTTGTLTTARPTAADDAIQKVARVERVHANTGSIYVMGAGRSNDIPNLASGHVFIGNGAGYEKRALVEADISDLAHFSGDYDDLTNKPTLYTDSDVDAHLNNSGIAAETQLTWNGTDYYWRARSTLSGFHTNFDNHINVSTATADQHLAWSGSDYEWVDAAAYADADVDTHLNTSSASANEVLSWTGSDYDWVAQSGGTASTTPTLTATSTQYFSGSATISNYSSAYDKPTVFAQVLDGATVVIDDSAITVDSSGNLSWDWGSATAKAYTLSVKVQDFGENASAAGTVSITKASTNFQYWRLDGFTGRADSSNRVMVNEFRLYTAADKGGTAYPGNMTSNTAPSPYVASADHEFSGYEAYKAFDSNAANTGWWNLGTTTALTDGLEINLGSAVDVKSIFISPWQSTYLWTGATIKASTTGAFAGEEVTIATVTGVPAAGKTVQ